MWRYNGKERPDFAEETKEGEESVWDYPRPPALSPDRRTVEVKWNDKQLAQSTRAIRLLETASAPGFYIPLSDVNMEYLEEIDRTSFCEWKGTANYYNVVVGGQSVEMAAWTYKNPNPPFSDLAGYISFYPGKVDCFVNDIKVEPQPGRFYGGWITPEIVGPIKGEPGSGGW